MNPLLNWTANATYDEFRFVTPTSVIVIVSTSLPGEWLVYKDGARLWKTNGTAVKWVQFHDVALAMLTAMLPHPDGQPGGLTWVHFWDVAGKFRPTKEKPR
jgi:hypothetical protein